MSRMKQIATMIDEGASINAIASQLQDWDKSITRKEAIMQAYRYMKEWKKNAGISFAGYSNTPQNTTEEYNGTSWATGGTLGTARHEMGGTGTQNATLGFGAGTPGTAPHPSVAF
jgi:hypothetical protein